MPRIAGAAVPKYRKHKPSGQAVVTIAAKDYYLGPHGTKISKFEYDRLVGEWLAAGRPSFGPEPPAAISVAEVMAAYWKFCQRHYVKNGQPTGEQSNIRLALRWVKDRYGRTPAAEFGPRCLKAVRLRMIEAGNSRRVVNHDIGRIRRMFKWAASEQLVSVSVYQSLATVQGLQRERSDARETEPVAPIDDATVEATLPHLSPIVADMIRLQRLTGMRPAEVCIMRPADIDRTGEAWAYRPESHKTQHRGRERVVFIGPRGQAILLPYLLRSADAHCFSPAESERKRRAERHAQRKTPLSCGNKPGSKHTAKPARVPGECFDAYSYRRAIHRACDLAFPPPAPLARCPGETLKTWAARLTDAQRKELAVWQSGHRWSPNRLRHNAATEIRAKFGLEAAQTVLGHSMADVTQIYAERDMAKAAAVAKAIG